MEHRTAFSGLYSTRLSRMDDRLSALARFQRAVADCAAAREDDAAFAEAISALGLVAWNLSHEIERRLKE